MKGTPKWYPLILGNPWIGESKFTLEGSGDFVYKYASPCQPYNNPNYPMFNLLMKSP